MGLMSLVGTLMMGYLIFFARQNLRYQAVQETLVLAEKALQQIVGELSCSRAEAIRRDISIAGIVVPRASKMGSSSFLIDAQGAPLWSSWKAFGVTKGCLWVAEQSFITAVTSGGELSAGPASAPSTWRQRQLLKDVQAFEATGPTNGAFRVRLYARTLTGYQVEFLTSVVPQN